MMDPGELHSNLGQFSGSMEWLRLAQYPKVIASQGAQYLAENGECWWLLEAIASHLMCNRVMKAHCKKNERFDSLHFWTLRRAAEGAVLSAAEDSGYEPVVEQVIEYTDFPFPEDGEYKLYCGHDAADQPYKIYLASEY